MKYVGGRKIMVGIGAALLLTIMAPILDAEYTAYAMWLVAALGLTSGTVAAEDIAKKRQH